jgi:hypothetical protein
MAEYNRLAGAPVLVKDLDAVRSSEGVHALVRLPEFAWADWRLSGSTAPATPIAPNASNTARHEVARESRVNGM